MRRPLLVAGLVGSLSLLAPPAAAENPVYDGETAADIAEAFAEATAKQQVCYAVSLLVRDADTGRWGGSYTVSSAGADQLLPATCSRSVTLAAEIDYVSEFSEAEDTASWQVDSSLGAPTAEDLRRLGLSAEVLLDDARSEQGLLNAALALPALTAERVPGVPPLVLEAAASAPPPEARPTGSPGSDVLRQHGGSLALLALLVLGGLFWAFRAATRPAHPTGAGAYGLALRRAVGMDDDHSRHQAPPPHPPTEPETR